MKSIVLILPYFGEWPVWFDAHLLSIANNPTIDWLIVTDCEIPKEFPNNMTFKATDLHSLNQQVNELVNVNMTLSPRKLCDIRPAYGAIFYEEIKNYDFWGFCDMDIIWGNIRKYIIPKLLDTYEIISSLEEMISGHFTLFKNTEKINSLYTEIKGYKQLFEESTHLRLDEQGFTNFLKESKLDQIKIFWDKEEVNKGIKSEVHQEYFLDRWFYKEGAILDLHSPTHKEHMYLHFINWKRTMKSCEVRYSEQPETFYISYSKIHYQKHSDLKKALLYLKNFVWGYYQYERYELLKRKYKKRINRKLKNIFK